MTPLVVLPDVIVSLPNPSADPPTASLSSPMVEQDMRSQLAGLLRAEIDYVIFIVLSGSG